VNPFLRWRLTLNESSCHGRMAQASKDELSAITESNVAPVMRVKGVFIKSQAIIRCLA
jgi:hypothetical protein